MDLPIVIFIAEDDTISREASVMWQTETIHELRLYQFEGNHFYLFENTKQVVKTILFELENAKAPQNQIVNS
jgi:surfactin synthase thioesterase subunit